MDTTQMALAVSAAIFSTLAGFNIWKAFEAWNRSKRHKAALEHNSELAARKGAHGSALSDTSNSASSFSEMMVNYMKQTTRDISLKRGIRFTHNFAFRSRWFDENAQLAGLSSSIGASAFTETSIKLCILGACIGAVLGLMFSAQLAVVLMIVGAYFGLEAPSRAISGYVKWRAHQTERHLPEMLDVITLGMRSGLSFDTALALYSDHFDTILSKELANAQRQWTSGLIRRDEALRKVAASYDSVIFGRTTETIVRSIRYGSSMISSLESDAAEARSAYQSQREERIAKAPVKMMIPTGVLILPAMLMLVLGPVLLELMGGGI